jgi:hypothetical protein
MDVTFVVFVIAIAWLGWFRGFLAQVAGFVAAVLLWIFFDSWYPPADLALAGLGPAFGAHPYLRKLVGFLGAYWACMVLVFALEAAVVRKARVLERGNRWLGVGVGLLKGLVYATALLWMVETSLLWRKPADRPAPSWLRESVAVDVLGPWNPVRVLSLREALEERIAQNERAAAGDDDSARDGVSGEDPQAPPPRLEESGSVRRLFLASPIRKLMEETATESEWQGRGYGDLVMDPKVREVLGDADLMELLLGE